MIDDVWTTIVEPADLASRLGSDGLVVIDCRFTLTDPAAGHRAYRSGHIPGARYAHLDNDLSGRIIPGKSGRHPLPDPREFAVTLQELGVSNDSQVVAYDDAGGAIAARLWWLLNWMGHTRVAVLNGGWATWTAGGFSVSSGEARHLYAARSESSGSTGDSGDGRRRPAPFTPNVRNELVVSAGDIENATYALFDAREYDRYLGRTEPIDPIAGHIPGARSLPYRGNLTADGRFREESELRKRFVDEGIRDGGIRDEGPRPVFYCGSGVTAAHNVLAMRHAGLGWSKLYAGSWSDWITDPARDVATGSE